MRSFLTSALDDAAQKHESSVGISFACVIYTGQHTKCIGKGAFTRVPQVDQRGWFNEIEFNG
jgi:hypothetical protein